MASFSNVFSSSNVTETNTNGELKNQQEFNRFSSIDLNPSNNRESLPSQNHSTSTINSNVDTYETTDSAPTHARRSFATNSAVNRSTSFSDRRISTPDVSKLSIASSSALATVGPTLDKFKQWSRLKYKCTKQSLFEKLGKATRTVDTELDARIENLRETKRRYEMILALARSYANHFANLMLTQRALSEQFVELKQHSPLLHEEFSHNAETQLILVRNGEILLGALNFFISTIQTLCSKTIEDTINTIRSYEISRVEYDISRSELEILPPGPSFSLKQQDFDRHKEKYEQLKLDVRTKLQLLDENQIKVMKNQLLLFHNAIAAYFAGNQAALDATMKQFSLKVPTIDDHSDNRKSFLEQPPH